MIKEAKISDYDIISEIATDVNKTQIFDEDIMEIREALTNYNKIVYIDYENEIPVAFAQCSLKDEEVKPTGYLEHMFIKKNYQNKGIAKKLLNKCETWAKEKGYHPRKDKSGKVYQLAREGIPTLECNANTKLQVTQAAEAVLGIHKALYQILTQLRDIAITRPEYSVIRAMPGVGDTLAPLLVAEVGDPRKYHSGAALVAYTGIDVPPEEDQPFCNLVDLFEKIVDIVEKNEWKEYNSPLEIYSVYQPIQDIGHDSLRKDMKYIFTTHPLLIEETIENKKDVLLDLSSKDGEYGFVYFSNMFHNKEDALFRQSLSKQLDDQISKLNAGKVIGGAIGKSYSYIDWIVYDKTNFIKALESAKKQLNKSVELHYEPFNDILD